MSTAHRPTWNSAQGGSQQGGNVLTVPSRMYSAKDLPGYMKMNLRQIDQKDPEDIQHKDFKQDLLKKEQLYKERISQLKKNERNEVEDDIPVIKMVKAEQNENNNPFPQDEDDDENYHSSKTSESDEDSEEELLMQEFEKIKREREIENKKKKKEDMLQQQQEDLLAGNPLMSNQGYSLERKWFEDTVFKNQTRTEVKPQKRFINDNLRSDFHKKFMNKYVLK